MRSNPLFATLILLSWVAAAAAQDGFKLVGTAEFNRTAPATVDVEYTGAAAPAADSPYLDASNWKVYWTAAGGQVHVAGVASVSADTMFQALMLHLTGDVPPLSTTTWKVLFTAQGAAVEMPQLIAGTPLPHPPAQPGQPSVAAAKKQPFFSPPPAGKTPDITLTGSFQAAGGSKPIYALELKGTLQSPRAAAGFHPAVATDIAINENKKPPTNTTSFNPDSITAGLAFDRVFAVQRASLYGVIVQMGLPNGEFSASDPSSTILFNPAASLVLNSWQPRAHKLVYATLYPYFALEAGRNLSKPSSIGKTPVNFSNYNNIVRTVLGADAAYMVASPDGKGNIFSLTGTYRVRLPEFAEPQVRTLHQTTAITLGTNARHWFEGDLNYSPWSFKYLALTGKYQYGELPPLFKLVDHSFSIGFTLQASQSVK